jgi:hypothetical protein
LEFTIASAARAGSPWRLAVIGLPVDDYCDLLADRVIAAIAGG